MFRTLTHATTQRRDENLETEKQFSCFTLKLFVSAFRCVVAALREIGLDLISSALGLGTNNSAVPELHI